MKTSFARAAVAVCLLGSATVVTPAINPIAPAEAATATPAPSIKVSKPVAAQLDAAKKLMDANDFASAVALIKQTQALPSLTDSDQYAINIYLARAAINANDFPTTESAAAAAIASPQLQDADKEFLYAAAVFGSTRNKHYDQTIKYADLYNAMGKPPSFLVLASLAEAYYNMGDYPKAEDFARKAIASKPGEAPNRGALSIIVNAQLKAKNQAGAQDTMRQILTYYNDPDDWAQMIDVSFNVRPMKEVEALFLYRLRMATKATANGADDYTIPANIAIGLGYAVEAKDILDTGIAAGAVQRNAAYNSIADRAAKDRASIASFDALARKTPTGDFDLRLAETYYGYGRYADAVEAANRALSKGTKIDPNEAKMVIGMSLARQGKSAEAAAAFNGVNGTPAMNKAKEMWLLYANAKYVSAPAAAAPAH
ncbi:MAG: tetratricopeptide repeat protein [Alphaproteobacteria bacterium]|nr:tetratricopeptide repeat protein [Alphaproteobacteria bacterium]MBV9419865.1 tetratricopeptide repeat protein [Alphaproteobacteria bacterium]MBV9905261.1 tetratricopeptide repeat protein [Alphaproteobacteria bacterium]